MEGAELGPVYSRSSDDSFHPMPGLQQHNMWSVEAANERRRAILEDIDNAKFG